MKPELINIMSECQVLNTVQSSIINLNAVESENSKTMKTREQRQTQDDAADRKRDMGCQMW